MKLTYSFFTPIFAMKVYFMVAFLGTGLLGANFTRALLKEVSRSRYGTEQQKRQRHWKPREPVHLRTLLMRLKEPIAYTSLYRTTMQ